MLKFYFFTLFCFALNINIFSQAIRGFSEAEKNQLARLNELVSIYNQENSYEKAGQTYSQIAKIYWSAGRLREAVDSYISASENYLQVDKLIEVRNIYTNIGVVYTDLEELEFAQEYFNKSLAIRKKIGDKSGIAAGLIDIAYMQQLLNNHDDAIDNIESALKLATEVKNAQLILDCYQLLATNYEQIGNTKKSKENMAKWEQYQSYLQTESVKETYTEEVIETQKKVAQTEEEMKLAAEVFRLKQELAKQTEDSLTTTIQSQSDSLSAAAAEARNRKLQIQNLEQYRDIQELKQKESEARAKNLMYLVIMSIGGLVLMIAIAIIMLRANRARKKANQKLEKQNKEIAEKSEQLGVALKKIAHQNQNITQSINYAKGIQTALLPKSEQLNELLDDSFILFNPRDIVSGDFYYFREIDAKSDIFKIFGMHRREDETSKEKGNSSKIVISAVDCTGHGVPGAFMSMIGYNLLDEITNKGITRPDLILEELHRGVRFTLKQRETNNQDGMDMAICVVDKVKKQVEFAGAKNPLIYFQNGEVKQIKGDKNGIGGKSDDHKYQNHVIDVHEPTWFYMFSDGFIDQFGGDQGRKFMIKNFREMLAEIHEMPLAKQKEYLNKVFKDWVGTKYSQIDDVLVIGFKLDFSSN